MMSISLSHCNPIWKFSRNWGSEANDTLCIKVFINRHNVDGASTVIGAEYMQGGEEVN